MASNISRTWACFEVLSKTHFELRCPPLHWSSITENTGFKAEFTLSSSSFKVNFTEHHDKHSWKIPVASFLQGLRFGCQSMRRPPRPHGYYWAICSFSSGGNLIQRKTQRNLWPVPKAYSLGTSNQSARGWKLLL